MFEGQQDQVIVSEPDDLREDPATAADVNAAQLAQPEHRTGRFHGRATDANHVALAVHQIDGLQGRVVFVEIDCGTCGFRHCSFHFLERLTDAFQVLFE